MAVNPMLIKAALQVAASAATNEKSRQVLIIAIMLPFLLILLVLASPFAIFFAVSGQGDQEISISQFMESLHSDFIHQIEVEQEEMMDEVHLVFIGSEDGQVIDNSGDVLIIYGVKNNLMGEGAQQVSVLSEKQLKDLKQLHGEMNQVEVDIDEILVEKPRIPESSFQTNKPKEDDETFAQEHGDSDIQEMKRIKTITVNSMTAEEMAEIYGFNEEQKVLIKAMKTNTLTQLLNATTNMEPSQKEIEAIRTIMEGNTTFKSEALVEVAKFIVGKVHYFWGGKSLVTGWDSRWGTQKEVTSLGSPSTGTLKPFGLDCSGFITWVFLNAGLPFESIDQTIGQGTRSQWNKSLPINESQVQPGDLAFLAIPGTRKVNHVGMVSGRDGEGNILIIHCSSSEDNVVESTADSIGLTYFRRPIVLLD